eukprot:c9842_g1_i1.p1 GENE.c9842_g1_i1~~c9842_g1_i1.p1  ORF type:complete len:596 (-),score=113.20 c9842_g1_i1:97-1884(-)
MGGYKKVPEHWQHTPMRWTWICVFAAMACQSSSTPTTIPIQEILHDRETVSNETQLAPQQTIPIEIGAIQAVGSVPPARGGHTFIRVTDKMMLLWGGCDLAPNCDAKLYSFDATKRSWSMPKVGGVSPTGRTGHVSWLDSSNTPYMWVWGGFVPDKHSPNGGRFSNEIFALHLATMRWSQPLVSGTTPTARYQATIVSTTPTHHLMFGGSNEHQFFDDLFLFDSDQLHWSFVKTSGERPSARESHSAVLWGHNTDTEMIVFGGYHNDDVLNDVYALSIDTLTWRLISSEGPGARGGHLSFALGSLIYVLGGCDESNNSCYHGITVTDPSVTPHWSSVSVNETVSTREWAALTRSHNRIYMFGGCVPSDTCYQDLWLLEFEDIIPSLQFVSSEATISSTTTVASTTEQSFGTPTPIPTPKYELNVVMESCNRTHNQTSGNIRHSSIPKSRPGRMMMDKLKEIRRELKLAEDLCTSLPGSNPRDTTQICDETLKPCQSPFRDCGYSGCQQRTRSGHQCQAWDCWTHEAGASQACVNTGDTLNVIRLNWAKNVADFGLGAHSYCRNPTGEDTIWCFTTNASVPWDYCSPAPPGGFLSK